MGSKPTAAAWLWYALGSAVFASLTSILGKVGISGVESNLGTAIRTGVVLVMAWVMVFVTRKQGELRQIPTNELGFICLSGLATGASLAVLLPGLAGRPRQYRRPHRQAEYVSHSGLLRTGVPRKADPPGCPWPATGDGRNAGYAVLNRSEKRIPGVACASGTLLLLVYSFIETPSGLASGDPAHRAVKGPLSPDRRSRAPCAAIPPPHICS